MCIAYFVILLMRKNMDCITAPSNIEGICRSCYTLFCFTILTILPIIAVLLVTYDELLRLILQVLFSSAKVLRRGNAKYRSTGRLH